MCEVLHSKVGPNNVVELYNLCVAFASETVTRYLLDNDIDLLKDQEKARERAGMVRAVTTATPLIKQFPWMMAWCAKIPLPVIRALNPVLARVFAYSQVGPLEYFSVSSSSLVVISGVPLVSGYPREPIGEASDLC